MAKDPAYAEQVRRGRRQRYLRARGRRWAEARERTKWVCRQTRHLMDRAAQEGWTTKWVAQAIGVDASAIRRWADPVWEAQKLTELAQGGRGVKPTSEAKLADFLFRLANNDPHTLAILAGKRPARITTGRFSEAEDSEDIAA